MTSSEEILSAYLDDELGAQERADVERRLASDAHWRETLEKLQEVRAWVQDLPAVTPSRPKSIVQMLAEQKPDQNDAAVRLVDNADISAAPSSWKWMMSLAATSLVLVGTTLWWISGVGQPIALGPTLENAAPDAPVPAIRSEGASAPSKSAKASSPKDSVASASAANFEAEGDNSSLLEETTQRKINEAAGADEPPPESMAKEDLHRDSPTADSMAAQDIASSVMTGSALAEPAPTDPSALGALDRGEGAIPPLQAMNAPAPAGNAAVLEGGLGGSGGASGLGGAGGSGGFSGGMLGGAPAPHNAAPLARSSGGAAPVESGVDFAPAEAPAANLPKAPSPMDSQERLRGGRSAMEGAPGLPAPGPAVGNASDAGEARGTLEKVAPNREETSSDRYALGMQLPAKPVARFLTEKVTPSSSNLFFMVQEPNFAKDKLEPSSANADDPKPIESMMDKDDRGVEAREEASPSSTSYRFVTDQVIHLTVPPEVFADLEESMADGGLKLQQSSSLANAKPASAALDTSDSEKDVQSAENANKLWLLELSPLGYEALRKRWSEKGFDVTEILDDRKLNIVGDYGTVGEHGTEESRDRSGAPDAPPAADASTNPQAKTDDANPSNKSSVQADFIFILLQGR